MSRHKEHRVRGIVEEAGRARVSGLRSKEEHTAAIRKDRRVALVVNTHSRRGRRKYLAVMRLLHAEGFRPLGAYAVMDPRRLPDTIETALALNPDLLIVGGGDGTLSEAVKHVPGTDAALGVLPLGTTNNFARSLGLPLDLARAIRVFRVGKVADVDLGMAGDRPFANLTSFGVSVEVAATVRPWLKRVLGRAAYPLTALTILPHHRPFRAVITVDGRRHELLTHQLNIANGRFHGGWQIARDISIDNHTLAAYQLGSGKRLRLLVETLIRATTGRWQSLAGGPFVTGREMLVEIDPPLLADVDGEVRQITPLLLRSIRNGLRVMVPPDFVDT
ncbi:diacylglycerol kinase [Thermopolyspora flexuosa]|jgi:YegS/Rv2252/BmrU family lipid kinase|uniref:YegS/Rv2252/BmrU family lipid kinase n=1 Tax=Thermopolyspora flexuosa TaxID=103836 RepID=A0A543IW73_9ACTN|nr:diacylglycerol kinase family protein [Thermopolyspora flexuosa]TQM74825.1 YegS/Rv2252/BmrU family lipid kinase [Thermopolyspora flexuosa]GGM79234.1 diacylglycerol kinase [Thermopolyspora flexuosa]